jgi:hypothetical protein
MFICAVENLKLVHSLGLGIVQDGDAEDDKVTAPLDMGVTRILGVHSISYLKESACTCMEIS